jgi:hypothetical protein
MDTRFRELIRRWLASPGDLNLRREVDAMAKRIGGLDIHTSDQLRLLAQTVLENPEKVQPHQLELAESYQEISPGWTPPDNNPPDAYELAEAVFDILRQDGQRHVYREYQEEPGESWENIAYHDSDVYRAAVAHGGCAGTPSALGRKRKNCMQPARGCICSTMCYACGHCEGWRSGGCSHDSECVCDGFHYSQVGSDGFGGIGFTTHYLDYLCGCRGSGWQHTDADSTHECPIHPIVGHHPECGNYEGDVSECCNISRQTAAPLSSSDIDVDLCSCGHELLDHATKLGEGCDLCEKCEGWEPDEDDVPF